MTTDPLHLLLGARADRPDVAALIDTAESTGRPLRILLTHEALDALRAPALAPRAGRSYAICTRAARERHLTLDDVPAHIAWSSVATWHVEAGPDAVIWSVLP